MMTACSAQSTTIAALNKVEPDILGSNKSMARSAGLKHYGYNYQSNQIYHQPEHQDHPHQQAWVIIFSNIN